VAEFNKGLADADMNIGVDSGGNFTSPDHRNLNDILSALGNHGWE